MLNHICKIQKVFSYCLLIWVSGLPFSCRIGNSCNTIFGSSHLDNLFIHINTNYFFRMLMNRISFRDLLFSNICKSLPLNTILLKKKSQWSPWHISATIKITNSYNGHVFNHQLHKELKIAMYICAIVTFTAQIQPDTKYWPVSYWCCT